MCAASEMRSPASRREPGLDRMSPVVVMDEPWSVTARNSRLGDQSRATQVRWTSMSKAERLTGRILPRMANRTRAVREERSWVRLLEVGGDALVKLRRNPYRVYLGRGLGFMKTDEAPQG